MGDKNNPQYRCRQAAVAIGMDLHDHMAYGRKEGVKTTSDAFTSSTGPAPLFLTPVWSLSPLPLMFISSRC